MRKLFWSSAFAVSMLAGPAFAQDDWMGDWFNGGTWYAGGKAGIGWMNHDTRLDTLGPQGQHVHGNAQYDDGFVGALNGGMSFSSGLDLELEGAFRYNDVNHIRGYDKGFARGSMRNYAIMGNAYYRFEHLEWGVPVTPFVGFGLGVADYTPYHIRSDTMPYPTYVGGPDAWGFAYQAMVGLAYNVTDEISLSVEYRWFSRTDQSYPRGVTNDYDHESVLFGVRYSFGEPPPPPPAAYTPPPPAPVSAPHSYLVFFDFNKSDLTPQAVEIVDQAAKNAASTHVTQLTVTGHTDTVGSDAYNMRLSRRRAESVAAQLEKDGIASSEIEIVAKGKRDLLVPTADGVKEPQNRRVQIVLGSGMNS